MTDGAMDTATPASVRMAAMNLLSLREHSAKELHAKLSKKFVSGELVPSVIRQLQDEGLQSDERFTEAFVNMRLRQGKGSIVIRMELKEKGISAVIIDKYVASGESTVDWNQLALKTYRKKYGKAPVSDLKEKAKRIRFLTARGFSSANIQYVFNYAAEDIDD